MKRILLLLVLLLLPLVAGYSSLAECTADVCNSNFYCVQNVGEAYRCRYVPCVGGTDGSNVYDGYMGICQPCFSRFCNDNEFSDPSPAYEYQRTVITVTTTNPTTPVVNQTDVYIDVDDQNDGATDDPKNQASVTVNGCQGFATLWCKITNASSPSAYMDGTNCSTYDSTSGSDDTKWYEFQCNEQHVGAGSHTAKCKDGSSEVLNPFSIVVDEDCSDATCLYEWLPANQFEADTSAQCCGDDTTENYIVKKYATAGSTTWNTAQLATASEEKVCCDSGNDCADWRTCKAPGSTISSNTYVCHDENSGYSTWYECASSTVCQGPKGEKQCYQTGTSTYEWLTPDSAESGSTECTDGWDNDCDGNWDYDTMDRGSAGNVPTHGDDGCTVGIDDCVTSASPVVNTAFLIECDASVGGVNSITATPTSGSCAFTDVWNGGDRAEFSCTFTSGGAQSVTCGVDTSRSYAGTISNPDCSWGSVPADTCSSYGTQATCDNDNSCTWFPECSGVKTRSDLGSGGLCLSDPPGASYVCEESSCGAACDVDSTITNGWCDITDCTPQCNGGYWWDGDSCEPYVCTGTDPPTPNAVLCPGDDIGLSADTPRSLPAAGCSVPAAAVKCEYKCDVNYHYDSGACVPDTYQCLSAPPDPNSELCPQDKDNLVGDVTADLVATCSQPDGSVPYCQYICSAGYVYNGATDACDPEVAGGVCGDGVLEGSETCDDGCISANNPPGCDALPLNNGDGCSATCQLEGGGVCGDGTLDVGEECDDGNTVNGDGCDSSCHLEPFCGDGVVNQISEQCDGSYMLDAAGKLVVMSFDSGSSFTGSYFRKTVLPPATIYFDVLVDLAGPNLTITKRDDGTVVVSCDLNSVGDTYSCVVATKTYTFSPPDFDGASCSGEGFDGGLLLCDACLLNTSACFSCTADGTCYEACPSDPDCVADLSGHVYAEDGATGIEDVDVFVVAPPSGFLDKTDVGGAYSMSGIPSGPRSVSAEKPGYRSQTVVFDLLPGANTLDFVLSDGSCESCADWETRCSVACSGVDQCGVPDVPLVCEGARPGDWVLNASEDGYVLCCEGSSTREKLGVASVDGCMDELVQYTRIVNYYGLPVKMKVYAWKPCE